MEIIARWKEKRQETKRKDLESQSRRRIEVSDFEDKLFIAIDGVPMVPISADWTTKEIIEHLNTYRKNYVSAKMSESTSSVAVF